MTVIDEIAAERRRQIEEEGWTPEHDDQHDHRELANAASIYAWFAGRTDYFRGIFLKRPNYIARQWWPENWDISWFKPSTRRRDLIKAGALIVAEIERLDREREEG